MHGDEFVSNARNYAYSVVFLMQRHGCPTWHPWKYIIQQTF